MSAGHDCDRCATGDVDRMVDEVESHLAAARNGWEWVLDDELGSPPAWRLAWLLHGMPEPLSSAEYKRVFDAFEARYGVAVLIEALRLAASMPAAHGSGVDVAEFANLVRLYSRLARGAA